MFCYYVTVQITLNSFPLFFQLIFKIIMQQKNEKTQKKFASEKKSVAGPV